MNTALNIYINNPDAPKPNKQLTPGTCAVILNKDNKIFLHKRSDTSLWALPDGTMKVGESISQCCLREIKEELNLEVKIKKLIGIYTSPNCVFEWKNDTNSNTWQIFVVAFLCKANDDQVKLNNESVDAGWFSEKEIKKMNALPYVKEAIETALHKNTTFFD